MSGRGCLQRAMGVEGFFLVCFLGLFLLHGTNAESCQSAREKCISHFGCGIALHNYALVCHGVINGATDTCSPQCVQSIASILTKDDAQRYDLLTCDCGHNIHCTAVQNRAKLCTDDVLVAMKKINDPNAVISCSLAFLICRVDPQCRQALALYQHHCGRMFRGEKCSQRCNASLALLNNLPKGKKLLNCHCEGRVKLDHGHHSYSCQKVKEHMQTLCYTHGIKHHHYRQSSQNNLASSTSVTWTVVAFPALCLLAFLW